jgi:hypothetical protein
MATRSRTTFKKRQKEIARVEKQREKTAKRMQRKKGIDPEPELTLEAAAILRLQKLNGIQDQPSSGNTGDSWSHSDDTPNDRLSH